MKYDDAWKELVEWIESLNPNKELWPSDIEHKIEQLEDKYE